MVCWTGINTLSIFNQYLLCKLLLLILNATILFYQVGSIEKKKLNLAKLAILIFICAVTTGWLSYDNYCLAAHILYGLFTSSQMIINLCFLDKNFKNKRFWFFWSLFVINELVIFPFTRKIPLLYSFNSILQFNFVYTSLLSIISKLFTANLYLATEQETSSIVESAPASVLQAESQTLPESDLQDATAVPGDRSV